MCSAFSPAQLARLASESLVPNHRFAALSSTGLALWYSRATERINKQLFPLSLDHLRTIIQYNNYRGLMINLFILDATSIDFCETEGVFKHDTGKELSPALV